MTQVNREKLKGKSPTLVGWRINNIGAKTMVRFFYTHNPRLSFWAAVHKYYFVADSKQSSKAAAKKNPCGAGLKDSLTALYPRPTWHANRQRDHAPGTLSFDLDPCFVKQGVRPAISTLRPKRNATLMFSHCLPSYSISHSERRNHARSQLQRMHCAYSHKIRSSIISAGAAVILIQWLSWLQL